MSDHSLITLVTTDHAGITRGRALSRAAYEADNTKTCGWVPANFSLTPFGEIASPNPWGSAGDLRLRPDPDARFTCHPQGSATALDFVMSDVVNLDGSDFVACPRTLLSQALAALKAETGLSVTASFEHEFQFTDGAGEGAPFSLTKLRGMEEFSEDLFRSLEEAGLGPENLLPEYGAHQFEVTVKPSDALAAADRAVALREILKEVARTHDRAITFSPKAAPDGVGNGLHIHLSLSDEAGRPVTYDAAGPGGLSPRAQRFAAGIVRHMRALIAFTACSAISGIRLQPHNWSSSYTWLGDRDRESSLRICPVVTMGGKKPDAQFNMEYRAADCTASPHLALAVLVMAGLQAFRETLPPAPVFSGDPDLLSEAEREKLGLFRLPTSIDACLKALQADAVVQGWFDPLMLESYIGMKRKEEALMAGLTDAERCARYAEIY